MSGAILEWLETPVVIVSGAHADKQNGMTAAWLTQVSFSPCLLAVAIAPARYTHELIEKSKIFAVSVLREGQEGVAKALGYASGRKKNKLAGVSIQVLDSGLPVLTDSGAYYECRLVHSYPAGDHTLFIGEVTGQGKLKGGPFLPFRAGEYF